jgi:RHS repeat-associated protein
VVSATVPAGRLGEGGSYKWRTSADDGSTYSADGRVKESWTSWCEFTVDTVAPGVPAISSEEYPAGQWSGGAGDAGSFTFSPAGANDVVAYEYGLDVNAPTQAVNAEGGAATVTMTPATDGPHTLYVRSRDRAGNRSPIKKHEFNVGKSGLTSPNNGDITAAKTAIAASASIGITEVTYQWRRGDADAWATVPSSDVTYASGGAAVAWPLKANGQQFTKINWDVAKTLNDAEAGPDPLAGPVQIRGAFNGGTTSRPVVITFDRDRMSTALRELGPGSVNALTGNYSIEFQDAALAAANDKINLTRTYNSRRAGVVDPMFGPGWTSSMVVSDSDAAYTGLEVFGSLVQVKLPDSTTIGFAKKSANATSVNYEPQVGAEGTSLQYATGSDSFTLVDGNGNKATFTRRAGDPAGQYTPSLAVAVGSPGTTAYSWERATVDGMVLVRPTRVTAPLPAGVASCETPVRGCRVVTFTYATSTTATGSIESSWGTYHGRLSAVSITAWDPDLDVPAMRTVVVVRYAYDDAGRLRSAWDPRLSWKDGGTERHQLVRYGYNADGILNSIAPAGEEPWQIDYTTIPGDSGKGRLRSVSRSALTAGTAVETVVYQVPTSGVGAPHNLSPGETPRWGQAEVPVDATAFFPATQIPTGTPSTGSLPSSWERATIVYLDANGRNVNTATPGGHLQAAWYDGAGNVTQQLTAANRRRSLDHSLSDTVDKESEIAYTLSTVTVYSADGQRQVETFGPEHDLKLGGGTIVRGRVRQSLSYDEGAPVTETPFDLVTTRVSMVRYWTAGGAVIDADARTTKTGYDWRLRKPTTVVVDPAGLNHVTTNTYDAVGRVASTTQPGADGKAETPSTMKYIYYSAAANASDPQCGHRAEWADMVCRNEPAGSASAAPLRATTRTYDYYQHPRTVVESTTGGRHLRTSTISYDTAGRIHETSVKTAAGLGHAVATSRLVYDQATGRILRTQSVASGTVIAEVVRAYDTLGRMKEYTDADGNVATTTYDLLSRVLVANDGKATQTFEYDGGTERRGLPTKLIDSQAGTFAGQYDDDGELARETWPNGIVVENRGDEAGNPTTIAYERPSCGQADCTLFREKVHHGGHGQRFSNDSTLSAQAFGYDQAGRLTRVADTVSGDCSLRIYGFDSASNRTKMDTYPSDGGECQTTTGTSRTWSHDAADRLTDGNTKYDDLGRTTAVAATDTVTGSAASVEYYANDMVRQITSGSSQSEYVLDVMLTRIREERTGPGATAVRTNHYTNDEDGVAWAAEGGSYVRTVAGLGGVAAFYSAESGTAHWKVTNLHGDFVATVDGTDPGLSSTHETDEFGLARANSQPAGDYGWLGSTLRRAANPAGLMLMGVRLYNPATGRFLTPDRVYAGSANAYDYANQDPVNQSDTSGLAPCRCNIPSWAWTGYFTWWNMSARTLWTSRWYDSSLNWLGRSLMDVLSDEVWGDFDRMQAQYRTRELDQVKCTVIKRYGWGKFKVFSARYLIVEWQQRVRIKYRYKFTKWITPWFYGVWIGYRITDYRYRGSGVYWTF